MGTVLMAHPGDRCACGGVICIIGLTLRCPQCEKPYADLYGDFDSTAAFQVALDEGGNLIIPDCGEFRLDGAPLKITKPGT
jgi:hypothetical protein